MDTINVMAMCIGFHTGATPETFYSAVFVCTNTAAVQPGIVNAPRANVAVCTTESAECAWIGCNPNAASVKLASYTVWVALVQLNTTTMR